MLQYLRRKLGIPQRVEIINFPVTRKLLTFDFLGYTFQPQQILCVSGVITEKVSGEGEDAKYQYTFRVFMGNQFSIAFHETDKDATLKKRELFMQVWKETL